MQYNSGGWKWTRFGSPGTVYLRTAELDKYHGKLLIQHGSIIKKQNMATDIVPGVEGRAFGDVELMDHAILRLGENETISVSGSWSSDSTSVFSNEPGSTVAFTGDAAANVTGTNWFLNVSCEVPGKVFRFGTEGSFFGILSGAVLAADAPSSVAGLFTVHSGAKLTHSANTTALQTAGVTNSLDITVGDDMIVEAGALIDMMAKGYAGRTGPGSPAR